MTWLLRKDWATGALLALAALLLGSGLFALNQLEESDQGIATIYADRVVVLKMLNEFGDALGREVPLVTRRAVSGELSPLEAAARLSSALGHSREIWDAYLVTYLVPEEQGVIDNLAPHLRKINALAEELHRRLAAGEVLTAEEDPARALEDAYEPIARGLLSLEEVQLKVTYLEREESGKRLRGMKVGAFVSIALGLSLAVFTAIHRARLLAALQASYVTIRKDQALHKMLDDSAEAIFFADDEGTITYANQMAARTFGYALDEFVGLTIEALIPSASQSEHALQRKALKVAPSWRPMDRNRELFGLRRDGSVFPAEVRVSMMDGDNGHQVAVAFVSDVSVRKQSEQRLASYKDRLREMAFDTALVEERQRRRIATDLHDNIGQTLALANMRLKSVQNMPEGAPAEHLAEAIKLVSQALSDARDLTFELSPPVLYDLGLPSAVAWLGERFYNQHQLQIAVDADKPFVKLDDETAGLLFRAIRELLTNVIKYAKTLNALVSLHLKGSELTVRVEDHGTGFDPSRLKNYESTQGFGLFSVREQITRLGGSFDVTSAVGQGTQVTLQVPLRTTANTAAPHLGLEPANEDNDKATS